MTPKQHIGFAQNTIQNSFRALILENPAVGRSLPAVNVVELLHAALRYVINM